MTVKVNPPPQVRIPDQFFNNPDLRPFFERNAYISFQMWKRTGGSSDFISEVRTPIVINVIDEDLVLTSFNTIVNVKAVGVDVNITLPEITSEDVGRTVTIVVTNATNDCVVHASSALVLGDASVIMNWDFMSFDFVAISTSEWVAE